MFPKSLLGVTLTLALGVGLALAQESPIQFLKVKEVDQLLKQGRQVTFVDVRSRQEYLIQHIKGALSVPLSAIDDRSGEIPREGLVVLY
jgi:rhodanese-related sulfurtransferase